MALVGNRRLCLHDSSGMVNPDSKGATTVTESRNFPTYTYNPPKTVEAYQWLPDDEEHTKAVLWWLTRYPKTRFQVGQSYPEDFDSVRIISFYRNGGGFDYVACPGDWIVRDGPGAYHVWEADDFAANYTGATDDD
jgi:hypothetical protein